MKLIKTFEDGSKEFLGKDNLVVFETVTDSETRYQLNHYHGAFHNFEGPARVHNNGTNEWHLNRQQII